MYYEFTIENSWEYYALIKSKNKKEAYKIYNENICKTNILKKDIIKLSESEALEKYNKNNNNDEVITIEELRNDPAPLIVLLDKALM